MLELKYKIEANMKKLIYFIIFIFTVFNIYSKEISFHALDSLANTEIKTDSIMVIDLTSGDSAMVYDNVYLVNPKFSAPTHFFEISITNSNEILIESSFSADFNYAFYDLLGNTITNGVLDVKYGYNLFNIIPRNFTTTTIFKIWENSISKSLIINNFWYHKNSELQDTSTHIYNIVFYAKDYKTKELKKVSISNKLNVFLKRTFYTYRQYSYAQIQYNGIKLVGDISSSESYPGGYISSTKHDTILRLYYLHIDNAYNDRGLIRPYNYFSTPDVIRICYNETMVGPRTVYKSIIASFMPNNKIDISICNYYHMSPYDELFADYTFNDSIQFTNADYSTVDDTVIVNLSSLQLKSLFEAGLIRIFHSYSYYDAIGEHRNGNNYYLTKL